MSASAVVNYARSPANLGKISTEVFMRAQQMYGIRLDANFKNTLLGVVESTIKQFGHKTVNISDGEHLANLNRIIVEDCLRYVGQYRNSGAGGNMGSGNMGGSNMGSGPDGMSNANPFAEFTDQSVEGSQLNQMVENLAAARGYRIQPEAGHTPRIDFAEPVQDHKMSASEMAKKLEEERAIGGRGGEGPGSNAGMALNEMLGTERPDTNYSNNPQSEYQRRLNLIRGRDDTEGQPNPNLNGNGSGNGNGNGSGNFNSDVQGLPVDLPRGNNNHLGHNQGGHNNHLDGSQGGNNILQGGQQRARLAAQRGGIGSLARSKNYRLSLDFRRALESKADGVYTLRFPPIKNLIGINLDTCSAMGYKGLTEDPNLSVHISNLPSRYGEDTDLFSKLFMEKEINNFFHYRSEESEPLILDRPIADLGYLDVSFRTWDDRNIDLDALHIEQIVKITKSECMKIVCYEPHFLSLGDPLSLQITDSITGPITDPITEPSSPSSSSPSFSQRLKTLKVVDDCTIITNLPQKMQGKDGQTEKIAITRIFPRVTLNFQVFQAF